MLVLISNLPEPYRSQAIVNRAAQDTSSSDYLLDAFTWCDSPQGFAYWNEIYMGRFSDALKPAPEDDSRIQDLERRIQDLEVRFDVSGEGVWAEEEGAHEPCTPPVALPEGFDRWENRGFGWKPEKPAFYRLLNPGEVIRDTDEGYVNRRHWDWEAMGDDCAVGEPFNPTTQHPIRRLVKSFED